MKKRFQKLLKKKPAEKIQTFPGFEIPLHELSAFAYSHELFIISLKNGNVIQHKSPEPEMFHEWLLKNNVRNIYQ